MKRSKKHKKHEKPGPSRPSQNTELQPEVDLNYYVKDRVELLQQTFSILKPREIKYMMPTCLRHLPLNELKELCLSELLGISSKRLLATLAGDPPPSDTESSSDSDEPADSFDAISLESISSDDAVLNEESSSGTTKECKRKNKGKSKEKKKQKHKSHDHMKTAERAGLTALELLELQARAQAIKSQLRAEQLKKFEPTSTITSAEANLSDDDVQIKEESPEIVELISSEEEKPDVKQLQQMITNQLMQEAQTPDIEETTSSVTVRNNRTIMVPKPNVNNKIKLNRNKTTTSTIVTEPDQPDNVTKPPENTVQKTDKIKTVETTDDVANEKNTVQITEHNAIETVQKKKPRKRKNKGKKKKVPVIKDIDAEGSDHDEISLQLSDTEKMDLLEDLHCYSNDQAKSTEESTDSDNHSKHSEPGNTLVTSEEHNKAKNKKQIIDQSSLELKAENENVIKAIDQNVPSTETIGNIVQHGEQKCEHSDHVQVQEEVIFDKAENNDLNPKNATENITIKATQDPKAVNYIQMATYNEDKLLEASLKTGKFEGDATGNDAQSKTSTEDKQRHKKKKSKKKKAKKNKDS